MSERDRNSHSIANDEEAALVSAQPYLHDPFRYCNLILFLLMGAPTDLSMFGLAMVSSQVESLYGVSVTTSFFYSSAFLVVPLLFALPAGLLLSKTSLRAVFLVSVGCCVLGSWLRVLINSSFSFALVGQFIVAVSYICFRSSVTKISEIWFDSTSRPTATSILVVTSAGFTMVSLYLPSLAFSQDSPITAATSSVLRAALATVIGVGCLLFFREKPRVAPSPSAAMGRAPVCESFGSLSTNRSFVLLFLFSFLNGGVTVAYSLVMERAFSGLGVSSLDLRPYSLVSVLFVVGLPLVCSRYSGKSGDFKLPMVVSTGLALLCLLCVTLLFRLDPAVAAGITLIVSNAQMMVNISNGVELAS